MAEKAPDDEQRHPEGNATIEDEDALEPERIPLWRQVWDPTGLTPRVVRYRYAGSGTEEDPFVVTWVPGDARDPMGYSAVTRYVRIRGGGLLLEFPKTTSNFSAHLLQFASAPWLITRRRWSIMMTVALCALMVSLCSSAYSGAPSAITREFDVSEEVYTLGISLFVLGFAVGPVIWAPLSEMFGRRPVFIFTYVALTALNAGAAGARDVQTLLVLRFLGGAIGSNSLVSSGAVVADQFAARERGLALSYYAVTPFLGPTLGPIIGGFIGEDMGWRWIEGFLAVFTGTLSIVYILTVPETYAPRILHNRAVRLSKMHGMVYRTQMEVKQGRKKLWPTLKVSLSRPWVLVAVEPIVLIFSVYQAIIYATLYMCFGKAIEISAGNGVLLTRSLQAAFPIVYQERRGWSPGQGGLAFLGVTFGMLCTVPYNIWTNRRYAKLSDEHAGFAPPETRLPLCMAGAITAPIGLFWVSKNPLRGHSNPVPLPSDHTDPPSQFAWTNSPTIHWAPSILAGAPFGFALCVIFQGINNYLVDSYTIFSASVLAGTAIIRSVLAAAFPLFTGKMYADLGLHWASSVPAFLALVFAPFPFVLYRFGERVRERCRYSAEAIAVMKELQGPRASRQG